MPQVATILGRCGLIPFVAAPALLYLDPHHTFIYAELLSIYALVILYFLVGVWWGFALLRLRLQLTSVATISLLLSAALAKFKPYGNTLSIAACSTLLSGDVLLPKCWTTVPDPSTRYLLKFHPGA